MQTIRTHLDKQRFDQIPLLLWEKNTVELLALDTKLTLNKLPQTRERET